MAFMSCSIEELDKDDPLENGLNTLIRTDKTDDCIYFYSGLDANRDNILQYSEIQDNNELCNNKIYQSIVNITNVDSCSLIESGLDINENTILDTNEVLNSQLVCPTEADNLLFDILNQSSCSKGGYTIITGLDTNSNKLLEDFEVTGSKELCHGSNDLNGENGNNSFNSLIRIDPEDPGSNCKHGGIKMSVGLDLDGNLVLQENEAESVEYVCTLKCPDHCEVEVYDTVHCFDNEEYSVWLHGKYFKNVNLTFREYSDKTILEGKAVSLDDPNKFLDILMVFKNKTNIVEKNKKHSCHIEDDSDWLYYTDISGVLTYEEVDYSITPRSKPAQIGIGANNTELEQNVYGFSSWFYFGNKHGDININLTTCK